MFGRRHVVYPTTRCVVCVLCAYVCVRQFKGSRLYVLGGDSYAGDDETTVGGTQLLNDVWYTRGTEWLVKGDRSIKNKFGNRMPRVRSEYGG